MGELTEQNLPELLRIARDPSTPHAERASAEAQIAIRAGQYAPSPGYDGGKSLGERLYEAELEVWPTGIPWNEIRPTSRAKYEQVAVTFTASLSGGEGEGEARPEPARERRGDPCPAQPANTDDTGKEG